MDMYVTVGVCTEHYAVGIGKGAAISQCGQEKLCEPVYVNLLHLERCLELVVYSLIVT